MQAISSAHQDIVAKLVPGGVPSLAHLTDQELLSNTRRLVGNSNELFAALLLHLAEVEARGIHRTRLCASLYTYCIYELRFSDDAAARRSSAARLVKQFPPLFDAIAHGELHLTGLLMIGPHLTPENHLEVLGRAKFRTKKELAKLVRELNPLPQVPDLVQPLGPALALPTTRPSWAKFAASWEGPVRELEPGQRPRDWANDDTNDGDTLSSAQPVTAPARGDAQFGPDADPLPAAPANLPPIAGPQRYQMQFTTTKEHVELLERAKALLARERPGATLSELHLEAMKLFVASLEKRKFAVSDRPKRGPHRRPVIEPRAIEAGIGASNGGASHSAAEARAETSRHEHGSMMEASGTELQAELKRIESATKTHGTGVAESPRQRGRYIPAAERRFVFQRDGRRCTFVDAHGQRCRETRYLEVHHLKAFKKGGSNMASNLALLCGAHNALVAEQDFSREHILQQRDSARHESLSSQGLADVQSLPCALRTIRNQ
jgi:hypothetical protein